MAATLLVNETKVPRVQSTSPSSSANTIDVDGDSADESAIRGYNVRISEETLSEDSDDTSSTLSENEACCPVAVIVSSPALTNKPGLSADDSNGEGTSVEHPQESQTVKKGWFPATAAANLSRRVLAGYLARPTYTFGFLRTWKRRFFRLKSDGLLWYNSRDHSKPRGELRFTINTTIEWIDDRECAFSLSYVEVLDKRGEWVASEQPMYFQAESLELRDQWASSIRNKVMGLRRERDASLVEVGGQVKGESPKEKADKEEAVRRQKEGRHQAELFHKRYELGSSIGEGAFSIVRKAIDRKTGAVYAVKCAKYTEAIKHEVEILKQLHHPGLISLHEFYHCGEICFLLFDYMKGGDLCDKLISLSRFQEEQAAQLIASIAEAMRYYHALGIVHRDIKPENILLDGDHVKIADFGLAKQLRSSSDKLLKSCGTPEYAAPELFEGLPYGIASDIFSLGVVCYVMLVGSFPFSVESATALQNLEKFTDGKDVRNMECLDPEAEQWADVSADAKDAVLRMLDPNPSSRITAEELVTHRWLAPYRRTPEERLQKEEGRVKEMMHEGFKSMMRQGIQVIKHGRKGYPHTTKVMLDEDGTTLKWESKAATYVNVKVASHLREVINSPRARKTENGTPELSFSPSSPDSVREKPGEQKPPMSPFAEELEVEGGWIGLKLCDILNIFKGHQTPVFKRVHQAVPESHCISIVSGKRSLDLQFFSPSQAEWFYTHVNCLIERQRAHP